MQEGVPIQLHIEDVTPCLAGAADDSAKVAIDVTASVRNA
jgi:hypothetical protein